MKYVRTIIGLAVLLGSLYFWLNLTGRIYFDPLCERYGESRGYTYTGFSIRYRGSPAECHFEDADGHSEHVPLREINKQVMDYLRGVLYYVLLYGGAAGVVVLTRKIVSYED